MTGKKFLLKVDAATVGAALEDAAASGLHRAAEHVLQVSRTLAPTEDGTLKQSARATVDGQEMRAAISYDTAYAVVQHERLDYHHDSGAPKYLERALYGERKAVRQIVADALTRALR